MILRRFSSFKARYAGVSIFMVLLVLCSALVGYLMVTSSQKKADDNESRLSEINNQIELLQNSVWFSREMLDKYLLNPTSTVKNNIASEFSLSLEYSRDLTNNPLMNNDRIRKVAEKLTDDVKLLQQYSEQVVEIRQNATIQYPALAIASESMEPGQRNIFGAIELAMQEILDDNDNAYASTTYQQFQALRRDWSRLIADFRMYLTNRLGFYNEGLLFQQEKGILLRLNDINQPLNELKVAKQKGLLGLQAAESVTTIEEDTKNWANAYNKIVKIDHSARWRTDRVIMRSQINPLYSTVWALLQEIESHSYQIASQDMTNLRTTSMLQLKMIFAYSILAILFIAIAYIVLDKAILAPINLLTRALKKGSDGNQQAEMPVVKAREIRNLLQAFNNMQQEIQRKQAALTHQALHDGLTGLANRKMMNSRLEYAVDRAKDSQQHPGLLILDLNGFKQVNDTLGHLVGDKLLVATSRRLTELIREKDSIVRLGGDEFAFLIEDSLAEDLYKIAQRILQTIEQPFNFDGNQIYISGSVGIARYPVHGDSAELLIQHADVAMYHAKRNKLGVALYDEAIDENKIQKLSLVSELRQAIENDWLEIYFQPKVVISTMKVYGVEALLRWNHPEHGFIPPEQIIALAEQSGLINRIFEWVFEKAAQHVRRWLDMGLNLNVAVNLSVFDFQHHNIVDAINQILSTYNLDPGCFSLEITESAMMEKPEKSIETLEEMDSMGLKISIDDFGTGYSSLSYLKRLPVDEIKIDKSFVINMDRDENDAIIVRSTIELAHNMGLEVVAEGIENQVILEILKKLGCDIAQGFHLAVPMPLDQFEAWLEEFEGITLPESKLNIG